MSLRPSHRPRQHRRDETGRTPRNGQATYLIPALLAGLVSLGVLWNGFVWDDANRIAAFMTPGAPLVGYLASGRGLTYAFHLLDFAVWGANPLGYHLTNLALHTLATGLVAFVARDLAGSARVGLICGLIFAVHPVHVEAVASFANRKDILALIFVLIALYCSRRTHEIWYLWAALVSFFLALYAKEAAAIGLPVMVLALATIPPNRGQHLPRLGPSVALGLLGLVCLVYFWPSISVGFTPAHIEELSEGHLHSYRDVVLNSLAAVPRLFRLLVWPDVLSADYPYWYPHLGYLPITMAVILLVGCAALAMILARTIPLAGYGLLWALAMYLPASNLVPLVGIFGAERYLYVPSFGVCLLAAVLFDRAMARPEGETPWAPVALVVALLTLGATRTIARTRDWCDTASLSRSSLTRGVETYRLRYNLGVALWAEGRQQEALKEMERAIHVDPTSIATRRVLAVSLMFSGQLDRACAQCDTILAKVGTDSGCHFIQGRAALMHGDTLRSLVCFNQAIASDSSNATAAITLASLLVSSRPNDRERARMALLLCDRSLRDGSRLGASQAALATSTRAHALAIIDRSRTTPEH